MICILLPVFMPTSFNKIEKINRNFAVQRIQLDLSSHPAANLLSENVRLSRIEIIKEAVIEEEQMSIDFTPVQPDTRKTRLPKKLIIAAPGFKSLN